MNMKAMIPATDVNPEPESMPASSREACPVLPNYVQLADSAPMGARSLALTIVATIAVVFALQWAEKFFIPLLLGIIIAYTLNPLVVWMERVKIPRVVGTIIVMLAFLCGSAFVTISMRGQIQTILDQLPDAASQLSVSLRNIRGGSPPPCRKCKPRRKRLIRQPVRRRMSPRHPNSLPLMSSLTSPRSSWATT